MWLGIEVFHEWMNTFALAWQKRGAFHAQKPKAKSPKPRNPFLPLLSPVATSRMQIQEQRIPASSESDAREASQNRRPEHGALHRNLVPVSRQLF
jgi:hypothetical protein